MEEIRKAYRPRVRFEPVMVPHGNGEFLIKPGKPIIESADDEIGTREFAEAVGIKERTVANHCEWGNIQSRRLTPDNPRSKLLIPRTEIARWLARTREVK